MKMKLYEFGPTRSIRARWTLQEVDVCGDRALLGGRSLEGRDARVLATTVQGLFRLLFGRALNLIKVQAHSARIMLSAFLSNAILGSGRWRVGTSSANTNRGAQWVSVLNGHQRRGQRQRRRV